MQRKALLIVALGLAITPFSGFGQQISDTINLKGVEIVGSGIPNKTSLSKVNLDRAAIPDVGVLLRSVPGVNGIKKGGSSIDPVIRGFRSSQLTVIADDGLKVEGGCPNRMDPVTSHIETDDIESIDIIKGPYTLRYGPSLGGVIKINTFKPHPYETFQIHAKSHTSVNSNPEGISQYLLIHGGGQKIYFGISGSYRNYGDYRDGGGNLISSSFRKYNFSGDVGYKPHPDHEILLSLHRNFTRDMKFPALPMDEIRDNTTLLSLDYHFRVRNSILKQLDFKVYNSDVYHEMDNSFRPAYSQVVPPYNGLMQAVSKVNAANTGGRLEATLVSGKQELITGADVEITGKDGGRVMTMIMNMGGIETTTAKRTNLWKEARTINSGLFSEYTLSLRDYKIRLSARLDYNHAGSEDTLILIANDKTYFNDTRSDYLNISANAGISKAFGKGNQISLFVGRGMRSPDMTERFIKFLLVGYDNYDYLGNPQLKPEVNYQADLILDLNLGKAGKFNISGYGSLVDSYISGVILPSTAATPKTMGAVGVKQYMNTGKAYFLGFETGYASPVIKGFNIDLSAAYTYGILASSTRNIFDENNKPVGVEDVKNDAIQEIPPFESGINLNYAFLKEKMQVSLQSRFVLAQNHVSLSYYENKTPAFMLFNLTYNYNLNRMFMISAGVQNLFNSTYYEHLNRRIVGSQDKLNEAGRSFYLNLTISL
ncbi:MAG TPA: TonB-dependent receptor [Bacteroidales bacterium]|nr:TonB-dependent receptor [Bacteroidales bacterium]